MPVVVPDHPPVPTVPRSLEAEQARIRAARAERLALLRPAIARSPEPPPAPDAGPQAAVPGATAAPAGILHFHRPAVLAPRPEPTPASPSEPDCDLDRIQGLGPDLIWALGRVGVTRRADLAECAAADLAARLGAVGRLAPVAAWIAQARAAMATDA